VDYEGRKHAPRVKEGEACPAGLGRGKHAPQGFGVGNIPCRVQG